MEAFEITIRLNNNDKHEIDAALFLLDKNLHQGTLSYTKEYLAHKNAFAFDPINLPLQETPIITTKNNGYCGFLNDMLPNGWNKNLMDMTGNDFNLKNITAPSNIIKIKDSHSQKSSIDLDAPNGFDTLAKYQDNIQNIQNGNPIAKFMNDDMTVSAIGGIRPKVLVKHKGALWVAKFESKNDKYNNPRIEYAMIKLAKKCGLSTPDVDILELNGKHIFLSKYFGLNHIVLSAGTLLNMDWQADNRFYDYHDLFKITKSKELFKRIAFYVFTKNMDDHPWNHAFLYDGQSLTMSPLYDMMPFTDNECLLHGEFGRLAEHGKLGEEGSMENLYSALNYFESDENSLTFMQKEVKNWKNIFISHGVSEKDCDYIKNAFSIAEKL